MKKGLCLLRCGAGIAGVVALSLVGSASLAGASSGSGGASTTWTLVKTIRAPMTSVSSATGSSGIKTQRVVSGNCGTSWIWVYRNTNTSGVRIYTGYSLKSSVIGTPENFYWYVYGTNVTYGRFFTRRWDGTQNQLSWTESFQVIDGAGKYVAHLSSTSYVHGTKTTCYSLGTTTSTTVR